MTRADELLAELTRWGALAGPWTVPVLFAAAFTEHVFPPFPGDLLLVVGAWAAVQGAVPWPVAVLAPTLGAVAGAWVDYAVGARLGRRLERNSPSARWLSPERLAAFDAAYQRRGPWLLVLNRFLPGVRAFIFVAAGASGLPLKRVLLLGGVSALVWNGLLLGAGALVAANLAELVGLAQQSMLLVASGLAVVAVGLGVKWWWDRRRAR